MQIEFARSARSTVGIEWEVAIVDRNTGELASVADRVLEVLDERSEGGHHPIDHLRAAHEHGGARERRARARRRRGRRPRGPARRGARGDRRARRVRAGLQRLAPLQPVVRPAPHRQAQVPQAHRAHPVVGAQHDDLGHPRARRHRGARQGAPDPRRAARLHPPPSGAERIEPVLGGRGDRVRVEPRAHVPAAAHGRAPLSARRLVRVRAVRRRPRAHRRHRGPHRGALGHPPVAALGHRRGARVRRRVDGGRDRRDRRARAVPRRVDERSPRPRRDAHGAAALVRAREQVARGALRHGRRDHHGCRGHRAAGRRRPARPAHDARAHRRTARVRRRAAAGAHHARQRRELPAAAPGRRGRRRRPHRGGRAPGARAPRGHDPDGTAEPRSPPSRALRRAGRLPEPAPPPRPGSTSCG